MNTFYARLLLAFLIANFVVLGISVLGTRALLGTGKVSHDFDAIAALAKETYLRDGAEGMRSLTNKYRPSGLELVLFENNESVTTALPRPIRDFRHRLNLQERSTLPLPGTDEFLHTLPLVGSGIPPGTALVIFERRNGAVGGDSRKPGLSGGPGTRPPPDAGGNRPGGPPDGTRGGPPGGRPGGQDSRPPPGSVPNAQGVSGPGFVIGGHNRTSWLIYLALLMLGIALASWIVARQLTAPLRSVQSTIQRFSNGDLSARVGSHLAERGDDLGRLAGDFDRMADRVEAMIRGRDRLMHHLSHEMRAPLARLRFSIELARDEDNDGAYLKRADREVDRLDLLMDEMLQMARSAEDASRTNKTSINLIELLDETIQRALVDADAASVKLELSPTPDVAFFAHVDLLSRAIDNVILNAIKYSPDGGTVRVSSQYVDSKITIEIADEGPGVPPGELKALFEPFYRASNTTPGDGYGLGLAIVASTLQAHDGYAEAENLHPSGLLVRLAIRPQPFNPD